QFSLRRQTYEVDRMAAEQQLRREEGSIRRAHEEDVVDRHLFFLFPRLAIRAAWLRRTPGKTALSTKDSVTFAPSARFLGRVHSCHDPFMLQASYSPFRCIRDMIFRKPHRVVRIT